MSPCPDTQENGNTLAKNLILLRKNTNVVVLLDEILRLLLLHVTGDADVQEVPLRGTRNSVSLNE